MKAKLRLLFVEPSPHAAALIARVLQRAGYGVEKEP
jgi:hypothetical protein